ncbi:MAG: hypothetical protein ACE3JQ_09930 [Paenisporosarcina sp.]
MTKDKKPYKRIQGKVIHGLSDEERLDAAKEITTKEWNALLEEKRNGKPGMGKNKKRVKKTLGKVIHGRTAEQRFKEIHGMTIEECQAKNVQTFFFFMLNDSYSLFAQKSFFSFTSSSIVHFNTKRHFG